ncbi:MAG: hypothetical protein HY881_09955 [Deltaproteobacteria bacterium]|nr:hypothetical protein [Deltaproteobacteria bacterium]
METPRYQQLQGSGTFSAPTGSFSSEFLLLRNPYWMGVLATMGDQIEAFSQFVSNAGIWQLRGTLEDGRTVQSDSLLQTGPTEPPYNVGFSILEDISFGELREEPPLTSEFPLVNCFEGSISMQHQDWELTISADPSMKHAQILSKQWRLPCEGLTLHCNCSGKKPADHLGIASSVMTLTSLALGTGVSSHRHILHWPSSELETWRFMSGDELGPGLAIPSHMLDNFISTALPSMESLLPEQQALIRLATTYINLSERPYLDTRLLAIMQAWEFLSMAWVEKPTLPADLLCLRSRIKRLLRDWRQDHSSSDPDGFWGSRLVSALEWHSLQQQVEEFASMWNIDLQRLGVDLTLLRRVRDSVAHTGRLPEAPSVDAESRFNLLRNARHSLRLVLLQLLGYRGLVMVSENGWKATKRMEEALSGKYGAV